MLAVLAGAGAAAGNTIIDLGPVSAFEPLAINNQRVIVSGQARDGANQPLPPRLWDKGAFVSVPIMDANYPNGGALYDINDDNLVVGTQVANFGAPTQLFEEPRAFTWQYDPDAAQPAPLTVLQQFGGWGPTSTPYAVNSAGDVVGRAQESQGEFDPFGGNPAYDRAVIWRHGSALLQRLETGQQNIAGDPHQGYAIAINDQGTILGVNGPDTLSPVKWTPVPLSTTFTRAATAARSPETNPNNPNGQAGHPLNDTGQYITTNYGGTVNWHRFDPDGANVPLPTGFQGRAIADNGRVVGVQSGKATLIEAGGATLDLNMLNPAGSPFSTLSSAEDINDAGDIIGVGLVGGVKHGYLLQAAAWTVDDAGDKPDTDTTDGQCLTEDGRCSLRAAIQEANAAAGAAPLTIGFAVPGAAAIEPQAALPALTRANVAFDGRTQNGGAPVIDGTAVGGAPGLKLRANGISIKGLTIRDFADGPAIAAGQAGDPVTGVTIGGSPDDTDDPCAAPCNTFTDNKGAVTVYDASSAKVRILGNAMVGDGPVPIDLGADGRSPDDAVDADGLPNFPVGVTGAEEPDGGLRVTGLTTRAVGGVTVDVYSQPRAGTPAAAAPARYLGTTTTGPTGAFALALPDGTDGTQRIYSATVTVGGATSELSPVCGDPVAPGEPDADHDGLCDSWERDGIDYDDDGTADLTLDGARTDRRDLYLEVDAMAAPDHHVIAPAPAALALVTDAFAHAPVDGSKGIALHIERDETDVPYVDPVALAGSGYSTLWDIRFGAGPGTCAGAFGTKAQRSSPHCFATLGAKRLTTRYALFADNWTDEFGIPTSHSSGVANGITGDALVVSQASYGNHFKILAGGGPQFCDSLADCTAHLDAATLMHEFGHLLGLGHGGSDNINYKPNFLSIMNYAFQFADVSPDRPLDYSRWELPTLDPERLDERLGILGGQSFGDLTARWPHTNHTATGVYCTTYNVSTAGAIDFNHNTTIEPFIAGAINDGNGVRGGGGLCRYPEVLLTSQDDWAHLRYGPRDGEGFLQQGAPETTDPAEDTQALTLAAAARIDSDGDGRTNFDQSCVVLPGTPDGDGDGVLDDCADSGGAPQTPGPGTGPRPGPGPAPSPAPGPAPRDTKAPSLTKAKVRPARFRVAAKSAKKPAAKLTFAISEPGTVTIAAERVTKGHRSGKRCSATARRGKACTLTVRRAGTLTARAAKAGTVTVGLTGRLGGRALPAGRYHLVLTARDAAGNAAKAVRVTITIR